MRFAVALLVASAALADEVQDLAERIEALAAKEPLLPREDTLQRAAKMLESTRPELAQRFRALASCISGGAPVRHTSMPGIDPTNVERLVEQVEHGGDDPAAYDALAVVIRSNQLSTGLDNPSIRARIAFADLDELLDPFLITLDGARVRLNGYRNKTVLLAFWATWCVPCRTELSKLEKIGATSPDMIVLALSWEPRETVRDFLLAHPYRLPMFIDAGHKLGDRFHIDTLPATVKLDPLH